MTEKSRTQTFTLRVPAGLLAEARSEAGAEFMSLGSWVVGAINRRLRGGRMPEVLPAAPAPQMIAATKLGELVFTEASIQAGVKALSTHSGMATKRSDMVQHVARAMLQALDGEIQ